jgi:hypothetical protein
MRFAGSHGAPGRKPIGAGSYSAVASWIVATVLVVLAVFGPPLTGQSIAALVELRHDILTMDREFERSSTRLADAIISDDLSRAGSKNIWSKTQFRGGVM